MDYATFAPEDFSMSPVQRNLAHRVSSFWIQPFGKQKVESQKFTVPAITEPISCTLLAKERVLTLQDFNLAVIAASRGSYSEILSFLHIRGSSKYRMGREPV